MHPLQTHAAIHRKQWDGRPHPYPPRPKRAKVAASIPLLTLQRLLVPAHCTEVGYALVQARQAQQALNRAQALTHSQIEQPLDAQAELDGRFREDPLASSLATGRRVPLHVFVQPDRQRLSGLERGVVRRPVGGLVARPGALGCGHVTRLSGSR